MAELESQERLVLSVEGQAVVLFLVNNTVYALDNRCPHMGFPLDRGSVTGQILTCHWHHARFDLCSGGTFDPWADDVRRYPVEVRDAEIWIDVSPRPDRRGYQRRRLREGLEHNLPLVMAKAVIALVEGGEEISEPFNIGLLFGARHRARGWGQGLTMLTALANLAPTLETEHRLRAIYQGLSAVAADSENQPPRFPLQPLPRAVTDISVIKAWFRQFVDVRDVEGAERCLASAIATGADSLSLADLLFAAATDHRYIQSGHVLDFTNKALEALDLVGWEHASEVLPSLAVGFATAARMEEANSWRHPVDLVELLEGSFDRIAEDMTVGAGVREAWREPDDLIATLLGDSPASILQALLEQLRAGASIAELASSVVHAAAIRIAQFQTTNEFNDWNTALHTFSFAHAVHMAARRTPTAELVRGVFDAAISVYLDRFLNVPPARIPEYADSTDDPREILSRLPGLLDQQQQVNQACDLVARYLDADGSTGALVATIGRLLVREDRDFHTIQTVEAAVSESTLAPTTRARKDYLIAAIRYLAAHVPTVRAADQTFQIAQRLARGEKLHEVAETKVATVLYTDIVDSTARARRRGDRRWRDLLEEHNKVVRTELARFGGQERDFTGDGFLALFDSPARALQCASAIVESVGQLGIQLRAGLHTGECEIRGDDIRGIAFHVAARVVTLAKPREVLLTSTVRDLVAGSGLRLEDRGEHALKGIDGLVRLCALAF